MKEKDITKVRIEQLRYLKERLIGMEALSNDRKPEEKYIEKVRVSIDTMKKRIEDGLSI